MKPRLKTFFWSLFFFLMICGSLHAQEKSPPSIQQSCRDFVQGFYTWYTRHEVHWSDSIKQRRSAFDPELFRLLKEDAEAQDKVTGEIVGLSFDPILASQDPANRYVVGAITRKGDSYWAEVYSIRSGKKNKKPDVVAEAKLKNGRWVFVNFHYDNDPRYPENENLLSVLKLLRADREKKTE